MAHQVPVVLPKLVAGIDHGDGTCLLLESAGVPANPDTWSDDRWEELAWQLGQLHSDRIATAATRWSFARRRVAEPEVAGAVEAWNALGCKALLADLWAGFGQLDAAITKLPACLCHGDWHLGNLLLDPSDRFVWIDWQEAGLGHGPEDLALLWQRAEFDGYTPPREAMLGAYARARGIPDDTILRRAAIAAELSLLLLSWPPYLVDSPEPARARLLRRLEILTDAWKRLR